MKRFAPLPFLLLLSSFSMAQPGFVGRPSRPAPATYTASQGTVTSVGSSNVTFTSSGATFSVGGASVSAGAATYSAGSTIFAVRAPLQNGVLNFGGSFGAPTGIMCVSNAPITLSQSAATGSRLLNASTPVLTLNGQPSNLILNSGNSISTGSGVLTVGSAFIMNGVNYPAGTYTYPLAH